MTMGRSESEKLPFLTSDIKQNNFSELVCKTYSCDWLERLLKVILFGSFSVVFYKTNFFNFFSFQL